ncbi:TM2 domain-containing protein [Thiorhodovibrio litoralis]|uniref:TM2 domain-containing protein n=2 Tax=Thiorhodovibrio TaxID=61593 RepID=UPI002B25CBEF|nr:TM2 domain-containing protein [Thiorhodovibrio litoralis]
MAWLSTRHSGLEWRRSARRWLRAVSRAGRQASALLANVTHFHQGDFLPMQQQRETHSMVMGYLLWVFGFMGAHRFYYGKPISGTLWFLTLGLLLIGWIVDLFLIPSMDRQAGHRFIAGVKDYNLSWILLTFLGLFGIHRFYLGKWITGLIWLLTGGLFLLGYLYDYWTLNEQIDRVNEDLARGR